MWEAKPLLSLGWLTPADLVVLGVGCLVVFCVCAYIERREYQKELKLQRQLNQSVLDAKSRVTKL